MPPTPGIPRAARSRRWRGARSLRSACERASARSRCGSDLLLDERDDLLRRLLRRLRLGVDDQLGVLRLLIRIGDARELLDLALEGLLVQALDVTLGARLDRRLDVHLDEAVAHHRARLAADLAIGRDRGGDHADAVARQEVGDERDPAD